MEGDLVDAARSRASTGDETSQDQKRGRICWQYNATWRCDATGAIIEIARALSNGIIYEDLSGAMAFHCRNTLKLLVVQDLPMAHLFKLLLGLSVRSY